MFPDPDIPDFDLSLRVGLITRGSPKRPGAPWVGVGTVWPGKACLPSRPSYSIKASGYCAKDSRPISGQVDTIRARGVQLPAKCPDLSHSRASTGGSGASAGASRLSGSWSATSSRLVRHPGLLASLGVCFAGASLGIPHASSPVA